MSARECGGQREREVKLRRPRPVLGACCGARAQAGWIFLIYQEQKIRTPWKTQSTLKSQRDLPLVESFEFCCSDWDYFPVRSGGVWPLARATITTFMNTMGTSPPAISHRSLSSLEITGWWWMRWDTPWWRTPSASPCLVSSTKHNNRKMEKIKLQENIYPFLANNMNQTTLSILYYTKLKLVP